ncbi:MAG: periplasmic heavy metal sensor [Pseudomonadota bacterium]
MNSRTLTIVLGVALVASVAVNLFAATAAWTVMNGEHRIERRADDRSDGNHRPNPRQLIAALDADAREPVRDALRAAGLRARPDFQASREARRAAVAAAAAQPYDAVRVATLLEQSREAEERGREKLETDALAILATLEPADRAAFARILDSRGRAGGRGERQRASRSE